jgi:hypothetical protein
MSRGRRTRVRVRVRVRVGGSMAAAGSVCMREWRSIYVGE